MAGRQLSRSDQDPRQSQAETLLLKGINAAAQAAAHAATFGHLAPLVGKLAENFCAPLLRPSADRQAAADVVKIIDIDLYADDGRPLECTTLRDLTAEQAANVIGNSLKSRPGTPIDRESLVSQPHEPGDLKPPLSPPQPGSRGDGPARRSSPGDLPVQPVPAEVEDRRPGPPLPAISRRPQQPPGQGQGQGRPSPGSGR